MRLRFLNDPPPPSPEWLVPGMIEKHSLCVISGPEGSGKSTMAQNMVAAGLSGDDWLGRPVDGGATLWVAHEAGNSTERRIRELAGEDANICVGRSPLNLLDDNAQSEISVAIDDASSRFKSAIKVVVVDSLSSAMRGGDENSGRDMGHVMGVLLGLVDRFGVTVLLLSHTGKNGDSRTRGHSIVGADATSIFSIVGAGPVRKLKNLKQRDAALADDVPFKIVENDGALRVELSDDRRNRQHGDVKLSNDQKIVLDALLRLGGEASYRDLKVASYAGFSKLKPREPSALSSALSHSLKVLCERGKIERNGEFVRIRNLSESVRKSDAADGGDRQKICQNRAPFRGRTDNSDRPPTADHSSDLIVGMSNG